jgi:hypothetical protein
VDEVTESSPKNATSFVTVAEVTPRPELAPDCRNDVEMLTGAKLSFSLQNVTG